MEQRDEAFAALDDGRVAELIGLLTDTRDFTKIERGLSLLGLACAKERWTLLRPLLALGADANGAPGEARPPLHWAIEYGNQKAVAALLEKGAIVNDDALALAKNDAAMLAVLRSRLN